jgi:hypothetical protein
LNNQTTDWLVNERLGKPGKICALINSAFYFINWVFIVRGDMSYRLIVNHNGKLLMDKDYRTLRGAKIAFSRLFKHRNWGKNVKAKWSRFFEPEDQWLKAKKGA